MNDEGSAFVSFNPSRGAAVRPDVWITGSFGLGYRSHSPKVDIAKNPQAYRVLEDSFLHFKALQYGLRDSKEATIQS